MNGIVLSCDRYRAMARHMIHSYERLWPDHPLTFRIPYQEAPDEPIPNVEWVKSPANIKETVVSLLSDLGDEEWVYWCIDDKYPLWMDTRTMKAALDAIQDGTFDDYSGVLFCRCRNLLDAANLEPEPVRLTRLPKFRVRKNYHQIWLHQFLRVRVIRHLFKAFPEDLSSPKAMDKIKDTLPLPGGDRLLVSNRSHMAFGESTSRGGLTLNCFESMVRSRSKLPVELRLRPNTRLTMGPPFPPGMGGLKTFLAQRVTESRFRSSARAEHRKAQFLFILGSPRSGTTLLGHLLATNPEITFFGESHLCYRDDSSFYYLKEMLKNHLSVDETRYWCDKILYPKHIEYGHFFTHPNHRFLLLLRHPSAILRSMMLRNRFNSSQFLETKRESILIQSMAMMERALAAGPGNGKRCVVFYEDLVTTPDRVLDSITRFLDLRQPIEQEYSALPSTGVWGIGDGSDRIKSGKLQAGQEVWDQDSSLSVTERIEGAFASLCERSAPFVPYRSQALVKFSRSTS